MMEEGMEDWLETWDRFEPVLAEAIQYDMHEFSIEDVRVGVESGTLQFWHSEDSAVVFDIIKLASGRPGAQIIVGGGSYDGVMDLVDKIEKWAAERGFEALVTVGRIGWNRTPRAKGWHHCASIFTKYLKEH